MSTDTLLTALVRLSPLGSLHSECIGPTQPYGDLCYAVFGQRDGDAVYLPPILPAWREHTRIRSQFMERPSTARRFLRSLHRPLLDHVLHRQVRSAKAESNGAGDGDVVCALWSSPPDL